MKRGIDIWEALGVTLLLMTMSWTATASPTVVDLTLVSEKRVSRTVFDYTFKVVLQNDATALTGVVVQAQGVGDGTTIIDGTANLEAIDANALKSTDDTVTFRQDRLKTFRKDLIVWSVTGTPAAEVGRLVSFTPPPDELTPEVLSALEVDPATGLPIVTKLQGYRLEIDPNLKDSITALGACSGWIVACFKPGERSLDDCARSVPRCATDTPWNESACCPSACYDQYRAQRISGIEDSSAFFDVYFENGSCFPK